MSPNVQIVPNFPMSSKVLITSFWVLLLKIIFKWLLSSQLVCNKYLISKDTLKLIIFNIWDDMWFFLLLMLFNVEGMLYTTQPFIGWLEIYPLHKDIIWWGKYISTKVWECGRTGENFVTFLNFSSPWPTSLQGKQNELFRSFPLLQSSRCLLTDSHMQI